MIYTLGFGGELLLAHPQAFDLLIFSDTTQR